MQIGWLMLGAVTMLACAGKAARDDRTAGSAAGTGPTAGGNASQAGAAASTPDPDFVPDTPDVPAQGDGTVRGSFEGNQGDGWDTCCTSTPGLRRTEAEPGFLAASDGAQYLSFDSSRGLAMDCGSNCADAQLGFWLDAPIAAGELSLYFDVINLNLANTEPTGTLQIDALEGICVTSEQLATIPLGALDVSTSWQTRCVTFTAQADFHVFGLYVKGGDFHIGLDAFRFGPPCHAE